jgi:hypothetical protein
MDDGRLIAEARLTGLDLPTPVAPSYEAAVRASRSFLGFSYHLFPSCFVCGPQRSAGDGLCIFPGPVADASILAAPWVPDATLAGPSGSVRREFLWSALDCPGAFTAMPLPEGVGIVLGELCASVEREVSPGDACVVCAWPIETNGKKRIVGSAIYTETGELIAKARGTWIEIPIHQWQ